MNREIKFRGKDDNGRWWFGDLRHTMVDIGKPHCRIVNVDEDQDGRLQEIWSDPIQEDTIGQYIGIVDNEGHPIYEGDIIKGHHDYRHVIQYFAPEARFTADLIGFKCFDRCGINQKWIDEFGKVVVGNIFDNPEMLEGGAQ